MDASSISCPNLSAATGPAALIKNLPTCLLRRFHFSHTPLLSL